MNENMKLNAVKNLMETLEFNQQEKLTLMDMLLETLSLKQSARQILLEMIEQELCPEKSKTEKQIQRTEQAVEQPMEKTQVQKTEPAEQPSSLAEMIKKEVFSERQKQIEAENLNEYGEKLQFKMLYDDGVISYWLRRGKEPVGIVIKDSFAIYCQKHNCCDGTNRQEAMRYATILPKIKGREWTVISVKHCVAINNRSLFRDLCNQLIKVGWRKIVESSYKEVLTSDGSLTAKEWEVWFVMDL